MSKLKHYMLTGLVAVFFVGVTWLVPLNLKNDLDGNLFHLLFIKHNLAAGTWSNWNPYLHQGLPVMADPINFFWYPMAPLVLLLPVEIAVKIIFAVSWGLAAVFAYFLFRKSGIKQELATWLGLTYASGGYYLARIVAGHLEKVLSYPIIALFLLCVVMLWQKPGLKRAGNVGLAVFLLLATTDMYNFFYLCAGYAVFGVYVAFAKRKVLAHYLVGLVLAIAFSAVRWLPILTMLGKLFKIPDPYSGSQNILSLIIQTIWPKPSMFAPVVPTNFGWWEKVGFIGPLFIVALLLPWKWKRHNSNLSVILAVIFAFVCLAIAMPAFALNPWHWALAFLEPLTMFHVPTRVLAILSLCFIIISGLLMNEWGRLGIRLTKLNLILIAGYWLFMLNFKLLPQVMPQYAVLRSHMPNNFASIIYPAFEYPVMEREWQIPLQLFHTTHGTYIAGSPAADWTRRLVEETPYQNDIPDYIVWPDDKELPFVGTPIASESGVTLYKSQSASASSSMQSEFSDQLYYLGAIVSLISLTAWTWATQRK